jgi:antitoxin YefM
MEVDMRIVSFSEARNNLKTVLDQVSADADYTIIRRRGSEDAVIMSWDTFSGYLETFYLMKSPANAAHLAESIQQYQAGEVHRHELMDE